MADSTLDPATILWTLSWLVGAAFGGAGIWLGTFVASERGFPWFLIGCLLLGVGWCLIAFFPLYYMGFLNG